MRRIYFTGIKWHLGWLFHNLKIGFLIRTGLYKYYVSYWFKRRTGVCVHCGHCCWVYHTMERCEHFDNTKDKDYCKIQNDKPLQCINHPLDPLEAKLSNCQGYEFK